MNDSPDPFSAKRIAKLAKLNLSAEELEGMQDQMDKILGFVSQLNELDLDGISPFFGAADSNDTLRPDQRKDSLERKDILSNAPKSNGEFYLVPPVFGDSE